MYPPESLFYYLDLSVVSGKCVYVCVCERERVRERAREGLKRTKTYDTLSSGINTERDYILVYYFLLSSPLP